MSRLKMSTHDRIVGAAISWIVLVCSLILAVMGVGITLHYPEYGWLNWFLTAPILVLIWVFVVSTVREVWRGEW